MTTPTDADMDRLLTAIATRARELTPLAYLPTCGAENERYRVALRLTVLEWWGSLQPESQR